MRIGFLLPALFAIGNPGNGITAQAREQALALRRRGHEVLLLDAWHHCPEAQLDVIHYFLGGPAMQSIVSELQQWRGALVMSPILDTNQPIGLYRLAVALGTVLPRVQTIPAILAAQARGSDVVICRSRYEQARVIQSLGVPVDRTVVALNGTDPAVVAAPLVDAVRQQLQLPERFVLHVSAYTQERKNVLRLVAATRSLGLPLVIAGHAEPGAVASALREISRGDPLVRILDYVDVDTRNALYALCHVFCLPSYHEGTGLAALEAGAAGARVVITAHGGARDYFGEHASYVDPFDAAALRAAIEREWTQPRNAALAAHIRESLSWEQSAAALEGAYRDTLARKHAATA